MSPGTERAAARAPLEEDLHFEIFRSERLRAGARMTVLERVHVKGREQPVAVYRLL